MVDEAIPLYRFGDLLALARLSWTRQMADGLAARGHPGYRISDAVTMRLLADGPLAIGRLGEILGITRQAARKVVTQLEQRGYATTSPDAGDARKTNVVLTDAGRRYARAVTEVIAALNRALAQRVDAGQLAAADAVLRSVIDDAALQRIARRIPAPQDASGAARAAGIRRTPARRRR